MAPRNNNSATNSGAQVLLGQSSPFFVHPSDGLSSITVSPILDGSNYHSPARSMRRALGGKMKFLTDIGRPMKNKRPYLDMLGAWWIMDWYRSTL